MRLRWSVKRMGTKLEDVTAGGTIEILRGDFKTFNFSLKVKKSIEIFLSWRVAYLIDVCKSGTAAE